MRLSFKYIFILTTFFAFACTNSNNGKPIVQETTNEPTEQELAEGFQLVENNCFTCHSPSASIENRLAPPMIAVKKHYINKGTSQEEFTRDLISFLNDPSEEASKMPGAVKRFNLMPKMNFTEEQITSAARYIYHSELEKPDWFEKHYKQEKEKHGMNSASTSSLTGQEIALKTKAILGKNLLQAINTKGTEHAVSFCSTKAIPLTDSMALVLNAKIKRVSDKNRNPNNVANKAELAYIESLKLALIQKKELKPLIKTVGNKRIGYYPILTNKMCMQCHGQRKTEILPKTMLKLESIYPNDKATGYGVNELRGIWVVEMDKE